MRLRVANALVFGAIAVLGAAALARPLAAALRAIVRPWSYEPRLTHPWLWVALAAALAAAVAETARCIASGRGPGLRRYAAVLAAAGLCLAAARLVPAPARAPAVDALALLAMRVEAAAATAFELERAYPLEPEKVQPRDGQRSPGFFKRGGRLLQSRVHVVANAVGPVLRSPEGSAPGDLVFAVDRTRRRYWITAFALDAHGRPAVAADSTGRAVVLAAVEGRAASRIDPLFPEYPRRSPPPDPAVPAGR